MKTLGIYGGAESGCALIDDGIIKAAINEERLNRWKLSSGFPVLSIKKVLEDKDGNKGKKIKIRELIYKYGYTQREIADYSGVHYSTISKILSRE